MPTFQTLKILAYTGGAGGVAGALTHDSLLAWTGAAIASGSMIVTAAIAGYHKVREARRTEDAKDRELARADRVADREEVRAMGRAVVEIEQRIAAAERAAADLVARLEAQRQAISVSVAESKGPA